VYFGMFDSLNDLNPYKNNDGVIRTVSKFVVAQTTASSAG